MRIFDEREEGDIGWERKKGGDVGEC